METGFLRCDRNTGYTRSLVFENLCCSGSLGAVSQDRRYTCDQPFGQFHRLLVLTFNIFALRVVWRYSTALRNYSATRRLLHFITHLIIPFRAQHTGT
ncbi:hypothetical protein H5410_056813 [Solanum commersonii]|uniref:Uncharacterized protein n=1 Tax=Solanum commersonii TaxID=4109 RepID=A0A9J5WNB7_SOLCO|nr:hypothetical protein H5410_056813 [Solanum commersonii]